MSDLMDRMVLVPVEDIKTRKPRVQHQVVFDSWWVVTPGNEVMFHDGRAPQCNTDKRISEMIRKKMYPECSLLFIEQAYIPNNLSTG